MGLFELFKRESIKEEYKDENKDVRSICTADFNKPECSLVEELRELQIRKKELKKSSTDSLDLYSNYHCHSSEYILGIKVDMSFEQKTDSLKRLKDAIEKEEEMINIDKRIKEIKDLLGIE